VVMFSIDVVIMGLPLVPRAMIHRRVHRMSMAFIAGGRILLDHRGASMPSTGTRLSPLQTCTRGRFISCAARMRGQLFAAAVSTRRSAQT
jgi:hypothetical protein